MFCILSDIDLTNFVYLTSLKIYLGSSSEHALEWVGRSKGGEQKRRRRKLTPSPLSLSLLSSLGQSCGCGGRPILMQVSGAETFLQKLETLEIHRGELKCLYVLLSRNQAGAGKAVKQEQEQNSPNLGPAY